MDAAYSTIKALLSSVPITGPIAAELFSFVFTTPLQKRTEKWMVSMSERLVALEKAGKPFSIEELPKNETFVSILLQATQIAMRTHQEEKLSALRAAVSNCAVGTDIEENYQMLFLNYVDIFTPWHLKILKLFDNPKQYLTGNLAPSGEFSGAGTREQVLLQAFSELKDRKDFANLIVRDLNIRGLLIFDKLGGIVSDHYESKTTPIGKQFMAYISTQRRILSETFKQTNRVD